MLFTSWPFLLAFLPLTLIGYGLACRMGHRYAVAWLVIASLVFYGFWAPYLIILIGCSIAFNYSCSLGIRRWADRPVLQNRLLAVGICCDLLALIYYKYVYAMISFAMGHGFLLSLHGMAPIVLPLGISFFTFTQIGYLIDCRDGVTKDNGLLEYLLFVTFFPHLIAGPILHNGEMMPQFADRSRFHIDPRNLAAGVMMFAIGMAKKTAIADTLAVGVGSNFAMADRLQALPAWVTALSYSMQLYFDFSGYSDMAVGLAMMFNVRFPANFNSPYKARSVIEYWQRWHMTLTRYINQYLYNPLAMSMRRRRLRAGKPMSRKAMETPGAFATLVALPTLATMALAGIWHGAGLQFVVFGLLHGAYLSVNHAWRMFGPRRAKGGQAEHTAVQIIWSWAVTYLAVLVGAIFFRAASCGQAMDLLTAMTGSQGLGLKPYLSGHADHLLRIAELAGCFAICLLAPNSQEIVALAQPVLGSKPVLDIRRWQWRPDMVWAMACLTLVVTGLLSIGGSSEFLYFEF